MEDASSAEIVVVGNEGSAGIAFFTGGETTPSGPYFSLRIPDTRVEIIKICLRFARSVP